MLVNADFSRRAIIATRDYAWLASPQAGVERVLLDRIGSEVARATSVVRYAPGSQFARHAHPGGEEILVLSGTFSDDDGDYPAGWYLRNPPKSSHQPYSSDGTKIFVKLQQFATGDDAKVRVNTTDPTVWSNLGRRSICPLHAYGEEQVSMQRIEAGESVFSGPANGAELLLLSGTLLLDDEAYLRGAWLRLPAPAGSHIVAGAEGATFYLKTGHLLHVPQEVPR